MINTERALRSWHLFAGMCIGWAGVFAALGGYSLGMPQQAAMVFGSLAFVVAFLCCIGGMILAMEEERQL